MQRGCDQAACVNQCQQSAHHGDAASSPGFNHVFIMACTAAGGGAEGDLTRLRPAAAQAAHRRKLNLRKQSQ